jgi:hypothetical protein
MLTNTLAHVPRGGFETTIPLGHTNAKYLRGAALDSNGQVIGSTGVCDTITGKVVEVDRPISAAGSTETMATNPSDTGFESFHVEHQSSFSWPVLLFWFGLGLALWFVDPISELLPSSGRSTDDLIGTGARTSLQHAVTFSNVGVDRKKMWAFLRSNEALFASICK